MSSKAKSGPATKASGSNGPKVVIVGAGSMFFGRQATKAMVTSPVLRGGTLALVDTHAPTLEKMLRLAEFARDAAGAPTTVVGSTDRREVLAGADFVVLTFANEGIRWRGVDTEIAAKYGVRMCSSDTIGPGGIFRSLREAHEILAVTRDIERLAPDAWLINYINPTTVNGILLMRHAPKVRSFALCDGLHEPHLRRRLLRQAGALAEGQSDPTAERDAVIHISGVNHFTWMTKFELGGKDLLPAYWNYVAGHAGDEDRSDHSKGHLNGRYRLDLAEIFGVIPMCIGHTKEYVPYYQGFFKKPHKLPPIDLFDAPRRQRERDAIFVEIDDYVAGKLPMARFLEKTPADHATDVIESMWGRLGKRFYVNQPNRGAVPNLPADAFLELRSAVDMDGPRPEPAGELPRGVLALTQQVLEAHELTVEAAVACDRKLLRRAMLTDPIVNSIGDADAIVEEMLAAQWEALPKGWFE
jgi:alpha-galactosidase